MPTDQTTAYTYDGDNNVLTMTAVMPSGTNSQTTQYVRGVGGTAGTNLFSNDLIAKVEYPDASTGAASTASTDDVSYTYDFLGDVLTKTDQNGSVHTYSYDVLGRLTLDAVTTLGSGVDGSVRALGYSFTNQGLPYQQTSYDSATTFTSGHVVNQVQDAYNGLGQLTIEYQEHSGVVNTSATLKVQYGYSSITDGSHLVTMTYPNGRILHYGYNSGLDAAISRISFLADDNGSGSIGSHLVDYSYQGSGTILNQADGNGITLTTTLDDFGRIAEMDWTDGTTSTDHLQYGYDRNSNVLYKKNLIDSTFSELYHGNSSTSGDDNTAYDPLNRLTGFRRGTLSSSSNNGSGVDTVTTLNSTTGVTGNTQSWSLDAIGNQTSVTTDGTSVSGTQNSQNELTGVGLNILVYDDNGNRITDDQGHTRNYDAWNRLVSVMAGTTTLAGYTYDTGGRRVTENDNTTTTDVYFAAIGQVLEERQSSTITNQYVWNLDYVNDLLLRDDNSIGGNLGKSGSGLGRRSYVQHDANFNIVSVIDVLGGVQERVAYESYGKHVVLTPGWLLTTDNQNWMYFFQAGRENNASGLNHFGNRDYDASAGTWAERDPALYIDGINLYQFVRSNPISNVDPRGLGTTQFLQHELTVNPGNTRATPIAVVTVTLTYDTSNLTKSGNTCTGTVKVKLKYTWHPITQGPASSQHNVAGKDGSGGYFLFGNQPPGAPLKYEGDHADGTYGDTSGEISLPNISADGGVFVGDIGVGLLGANGAPLGIFNIRYEINAGKRGNIYDEKIDYTVTNRTWGDPLIQQPTVLDPWDPDHGALEPTYPGQNIRQKQNTR